MDVYGFEFRGYNKYTTTAVVDASGWNDLSEPARKNKMDQIITTEGATGSLTFNLPTLTSSDDVGIKYIFVKLTAYDIIIDAAAGDYIADSSSGGQIKNTTAAETYASITLLSVSSSRWVVIGAHGTWTTV